MKKRNLEGKLTVYESSQQSPRDTMSKEIQAERKGEKVAKICGLNYNGYPNNMEEKKFCADSLGHRVCLYFKRGTEQNDYYGICTYRRS